MFGQVFFHAKFVLCNVYFVVFRIFFVAEETSHCKVNTGWKGSTSHPRGKQWLTVYRAPQVLVAKGVFIWIFLIIGSFVWSGYNFSMVLLVIAWCCLSERSWLSLKNSYDRTIFSTFALQLSKMLSFCLKTVSFCSDLCKGQIFNDEKGATRNQKALRVLRRKPG